MKNRLLATALLAAALALIIAACSRKSPEQPAAQNPPPAENTTEPAFTPRAVSVPKESKFDDVQSSFAEFKTLVITDHAEFEKVWAQIYRDQFPHPSLPETDFTKDMVLAVFMGEQPTSGYRIDIIEVTENANSLEVQYVKHKPRPGEPVAQVLTRPFCLAKIEKIDKPVRFMEVTSP